MPDLDRAWNRVRDKLPEYVALARKRDATEVVPSSQVLLLNELEAKRQGWCYGLAMAYLVGMKGGDSPASIIGNGYQAAGLAKGGTADAGEKARIGQWVGTIETLHDHQFGRQSEDDAAKAGLKVVAWDKTFSDRFYRFAKVAEAITALGNAYVLINSPNHSMAATTGSGRFSFYDPNFGAVVFGAAKNLEGFIVDWFDRDYIQKSYKGLEGGARNAPPAKSLVLKLRAFQ